VRVLRRDVRVVSAILCKRLAGIFAFWRSVEENRRLAHPAGAARRSTILPERRGGRKGALPLRGVANPCARAPFWHLPAISTGGAGGVSDILLVGFEQVLRPPAGFPNPIPAHRVQIVQHLLPSLYRLPFRHDFGQRQIQQLESRFLAGK
jgi:hypothetical protein